ncbi:MULTISPECIES: cob(I)yrinic acid a,c-diamide adenosyltransferase [unclassified Peribacillus]|uniref:cob(I)yrinic acid a,c-diamide adenosyltransferase n=1 Tax=unclassified Peribacillus TaxID=2675266 RepID=UPI00191211A8|nr:MULTISPECIES: cob(I)yrinic acid a,c-diamide adenosyltransferase [unclassified Peribacillus]MBK5442853.1 cob(I)yrinic acid a,c-diamide adenosyltransferase [Peribacillus sp. TH24]MBK5462408.1 cob(I)yrinic acid a,c-diamide adenosyltransferase [Peribacillus sp. TH27]MBK5484256.1 cob(I)yrinic acid a,c-diamide adenosyltransferase [Peribacillus sp. TH16]MBK5500559.1 cob(I)yrinic acid a,c-diamide adenosyltransferase [Peribacillus sp. TH14]WMX54415.1 cob(I)yrinic acid a,c-diamide adenosyltransferase
MKVYTKSGDKGETSLVYGKRVSKASVYVEAYGTCDEANSMIGLAFSFAPAEEKWKSLQETIHIIQTKLFHIGAELATPIGKQVGWPIEEEDVHFLEKEIDKMEEHLKALTNFILPGGSPIGASLHSARTIVRRAERNAIAINKEQPVNPIVIKYLNRLSDYLFVLARYVNHQTGTIEPNLHQV